MPERKASTATSAATSVVAARSAAVEAPPRRRGFWLAPDLVDCLRRFNGLRTAVLQDFTDVQTQLHLGANKAMMDAHHGNGFVRQFLAEDGMAEVLKLLHHPDTYVHREAFRFADALIQQPWVARELVGRQLVARLVPLIGDERGERPLEAAGLAVGLLAAGTRGGYTRDAAAQLLDAGGLDNLALALWATASRHQPGMMGVAAQAVHGVAGCGPSFRRRLAASSVLPALCSIASADLATAARIQRPPTGDADLPQLRHAGLGISLLAAEAAAEGRHATAGLLGTGAVEFLIQLQTPWLDRFGSAWRRQGREALQGIAQQHPAAVQRAAAATEVPFPPDTSPRAWQAWWQELRAELQL